MMARSCAAILITLLCIQASGCFATQDESLGQVLPDASRSAEPRAPRGSDAALEMEDLPPVIDPPAPVIDAAPPALLDAGSPALDLDAGHDAADGDAGHANDAAHDAHTGCREPWEPWECRG